VVTWALVSPVPRNVKGCVLTVDPAAGKVITGAAGAVRSTVMATGPDADETPTAGTRLDRWTAEIEYFPDGTADGRSTCHAPLDDTEAVWLVVDPDPSIDSVTVAPAYPVPVTFAPTAIPAGEVMTGAVSTENGADVTSGRVGSVRSRTVRVWFAPLVRATAHDQDPSPATVAVQRDD
jgi:hypothetical protein